MDDLHRLHRDGHHALHEVDDIARVIRVLVWVVHDAGAALCVGGHLIPVDEPLDRRTAVDCILIRFFGNAPGSVGNVGVTGSLL